KELKNLYNFKMVNAAAWLLPKHTLDIVGGFHPMFFLYGEDDNYCQRVLYHQLKIGICPMAIVRHDSNNKYHILHGKNNKKILDKFLNQIRVEYADVNSNYGSRFKKLKIH